MIRKIISTISIAGMLIFVGCGDDASESSVTESEQSVDDGIDRIGVEGTEFEAENTHWITTTSPYTGREVECLVYDKYDNVNVYQEPASLFCFDTSPPIGD